MKKNQPVILFFVLLSNISLSQFSSNLSSYNPAMTGLVDNQFGQINYGHKNYSDIIRYNAINGLYNYSANEINSGFGINFSQIQNAWSNNTIIGGSYQYTFTLSETVKLSVGTSLNYINQNTRGIYQELIGFNKRDYLKLNFGTAVSWKGLNAGISVGRFDLISHDKPSPTANNPNQNLLSWVNAHVWYDFQISEDFILSPSIVTYHLALIRLRGEHFNRFWWNLGYAPLGHDIYDQMSVGGGVKIFKDFHLGYNINFSIIQNPRFLHNFSLSYRLNK